LPSSCAWPSAKNGPRPSACWRRSRPPEEQLGCAVPAVDPPVLVHAEERVVGHLHHPPHALLGLAPAPVGGALAREVPDDDRRAGRRAAVRAQGAHRDAHVQDASVRPPPRRLHPRRLARPQDLAEQHARAPAARGRHGIGEVAPEDRGGRRPGQPLGGRVPARHDAVAVRRGDAVVGLEHQRREQGVRRRDDWGIQHPRHPDDFPRSWDRTSVGWAQNAGFRVTGRYRIR
jgi:hypothetical protein